MLQEKFLKSNFVHNAIHPLPFPRVRGLLLCVLLLPTLTGSGSLAQTAGKTPSKVQANSDSNLNLSEDAVDIVVGQYKINKHKIEEIAKKKSDSFSQNTKRFFADLFATVDDMNIKFNLGRMVDLAKGAGLLLRYSYQVKPSPTLGGGYYTRKDTYTLALPLAPSDWVPVEGGLPVSVSVQPELYIEFIQHFPKAAAARSLKNTYFLNKYPFGATKAQKKLKPGDLVHTRIQTSLFVGKNRGLEVSPITNFSAQARFSTLGRADLFFFLGSDNQARLRLISRQSDGANLQFQMGLVGGLLALGFDLTSGYFEKLLNRRITNILHLKDLLGANYSAANSFVFLRDYTMKLDHEEVSRAYDDFTSDALGLKRLREDDDSGVNDRPTPIWSLANPFKSRSDSRKIVEEEFKILDTLSAKNVDDSTHSVIVRNFSGTNDTGLSLSSSLAYGAGGIWRGDKNQTHYDNKLRLDTLLSDGKELPGFYFFPTWSKTSAWKALFSKFVEKTHRSANVIYLANENFTPTAFHSMGFYFNHLDRKYTYGEHKKVLNHLKGVLPYSVHEELQKFLQKQDFIDRNSKYFAEKIDYVENVRVEANYFIRAEGFKLLEDGFQKTTPKQREDHVRDQTVEFLLDQSEPQELPFRGANAGEDVFNENMMCWKKANHLDTESGQQQNLSYAPKVIPEKLLPYCIEIQDVSKRLAIALDGSTTLSEKQEQLRALIQNIVFRTYGPGILFRMIPGSEIRRAARFEIKFYLPGTVLTFTPDQKNGSREFYKKLIDIQGIMEDMEPDMRINGAVDSLTTRRMNLTQ